MKKMKTMLAAVCVVAASMGGFKAYNVANQSEADMLFAENVEALSNWEDRAHEQGCCFYAPGYNCYYWYNGNFIVAQGMHRGPLS